MKPNRQRKTTGIASGPGFLGRKKGNRGMTIHWLCAYVWRILTKVPASNLTFSMSSRMPALQKPRRFSYRKAFSLVEVTLALGIFSFGLIAVLGVLPVGLSTADSAFRQNDATSILASTAASLRGLHWDETGNLVTGGWLEEGGLALPISGTTFYVAEDGSITDQPGDASYRLKITSNGDTTWPGVHRARLTLSWPPGVASPPSANTKETVVFARIPERP